MRKFKEIVSLDQESNIDTSDLNLRQLYSRYPCMPGSLVTMLTDYDVVNTSSYTKKVNGVVLENKQCLRPIIVVATSGIVNCLCKNGLYKKGDLLTTCEILGVAKKYHCPEFNIPKEIQLRESFGVVQEDIDLRTRFVGSVKVRLENVSFIWQNLHNVWY